MKILCEKRIHSEDEMREFAKELLKFISDGDIIILNGNLGAGKTFLVKAISAYWQINNVTSPTFALVNEYSGEKKIIHFDFYRVGEVQELFDIGFDEYLSDDSAIKFIEWGELFTSILPNKKIVINIILSNDYLRTVTVIKYD